MNTRRDFIRGGTAVALGGGLGLIGWRNALAGPVVPGPSAFGALQTPDQHGVRLPTGFHAKLLATTGQVVAGTSYEWHGQPDGAATFATGDGGWIYVSNAELNGTRGGAGALRFDGSGNSVDAYPILAGTKWNCAGGATPWSTWLSCEEFRNGLVWECKPFAASQGVARPALGRYAHEAAVVDPLTGLVYLTEDDDDSRLYRFRPDRLDDLSSGVLEAAAWRSDGRVDWIEVSPDRPYRGRDTTAFARGEGAWFDGRSLLFCTTSDHRVWVLDADTDRLEIIYDAVSLGPEAPLREPDNLTVHRPSGDIYVAEDDDDLQLVLLADWAGRRIAAPFLQLTGHDGSEIAGPAFSPQGDRLYFSSQRGRDGRTGMTFEVTGPFLHRRR